MSPILFDTDVLIDHLRGELKARDYFKHLKKSHSFSISVITLAEIEAGVRASEYPIVQDFLSLFSVIPITEEIAKKAGTYKRSFSQSHRILLPDALIAATACIMEMPLYTFNLKDYPMKDITVYSPYSK